MKRNKKQIIVLRPPFVMIFLKENGTNVEINYTQKITLKKFLKNEA